MCSVQNHHFLGTKQNMAIGVKLVPDSFSMSRNKEIVDEIKKPMEMEPMDFKGHDEVESPFIHSPEEAEVHNLFETMKHEVNRLNSFTGKWPVGHIGPADLAAAGFFYLQSDDKVQCAFCQIVLERWLEGQKPLRQHMRRSPKCPFLVSGDQNVPIVQHKPKSPVMTQYTMPSVPSTPYIPKNSRMADIRNRLASYREWPRIMLTPKQLAECGLYYTGVADVVTCFFCGGSLGNWELEDDPWVEHEKFFSKCAYLRLMRNSGKIPQKPKSHGSAISYSNNVHREVIKQACEIFPKSLVEKVVFKRMQEGSGKFSSLQELCDDILEMKGQENKPHNRPIEHMESTSPTLVYCQPITAQDLTEMVKPKEMKDSALLCKICMDNEMGVVFQPCGHLVACVRCSEKLNDCPVCRKPITSKVRTYLS